MEASTNKTFPTVMNAFRLYKANDPKSLKYEQINIPDLHEEDVLVKVHAASITRDELTWPVDRLPAIPSYEFSGVVALTGTKVKSFKINDQVYGLGPFSQNGAVAEYVKVPNTSIALKPKNLNYIESSTIPLAVLSGWQGLFDHGKLTKGQKVLIHGAAGGVGHFAVQLAHEYGAYVIGTTSTNKIKKVKDFGADEVIDYTKDSFEHIISNVDLVFDTTGGERLKKSISVVKDEGIIVSVAQQPPVDEANTRNISSVYFVVEPNQEQLKKITSLIEKGAITPTINKIYSFLDSQKAFERSLSNNEPGKIVIRIVNE